MKMNMNYVLLDVLAFAAVLSAVLVITSKNPVISVLFLIAVFINVAAYLVFLGTAYLGLAYLIIYVGAIAILFLFVIMMLDIRLVEIIEVGQEYTKNLPLGAVLVTLFFFEMLSVLPESATFLNVNEQSSLYTIPLFLFHWLNKTLSGLDMSVSDPYVFFAYQAGPADGLFSFLQIQSLGQSLYTYLFSWLVLASLIFLLAMVGPIVLCIEAGETSQPDFHEYHFSPTLEQRRTFHSN